MLTFKNKKHKNDSTNVDSDSVKDDSGGSETFVNKSFGTSSIWFKIGLTLTLLLIYRVGTVFPAPGVDYVSVRGCVDYVSENSFYDFVALFGGGSIFQLGLFALGAIPYITASIIMQLLTVVVPKIAQLKREGQSGQQQMNQYTRYLTIALSVLQAVGITVLARTPGALFQGCPDSLVVNNSFGNLAVMVAAMVTGATIVMWIGETITERGIGNGMSLIIFASIAAAIPSQLLTVTELRGTVALAVFVAAAVIVIGFVVFVEQGQRRIPIHYQTRKVSQRFAYSSTYLPMKLSPSGVVPIIFASALVSIPLIVVNLTGSESGWAVWVSKNLNPGVSLYYIGIYAILVLFFNYFYSAIVFNPFNVAEDLNKDGGFIPNIRPGHATADYLNMVMNRLLLPGSGYLALVALLPVVLFSAANVGQTLLYSGISVLILVSVALDSVKRYVAERKQFAYKDLFVSEGEKLKNKRGRRKVLDMVEENEPDGVVDVVGDIAVVEKDK